MSIFKKFRSRAHQTKNLQENYSTETPTSSELTEESRVGDPQGWCIGRNHSDDSPVLINPQAAANDNQPPIMMVVGDPGSGKSVVLTQMILERFQDPSSKKPLIYINLFGVDSTHNLAKIVEGRVIRVTEFMSQSGIFDPFLYVEPGKAAELATTHLLRSLKDLTPIQQLDLSRSLEAGAKAKVSCIGESLTFIEDKTIVDTIEEKVKSKPLFALGVALESPLVPADWSGFSGIDFDLLVPLPHSKSKTLVSEDEMIALSAISLTISVTTEILAKAGGGALFVESAQGFLAHEIGAKTFNELGREARSLNIFPAFSTYATKDTLSTEMASHVSRALIMKLEDATEAKATLELFGFDASSSIVELLSTLGPRRADIDRGEPGRTPRALHLDIEGNKGIMNIEPFSRDVSIKLFSA